ncbi:MAG: CaiB/BaiF CoA transferase family protein [Alphaproteobacteria bacterium]
MTPLNGLKVLELARVLAGPWAGQTLADLGATVIKVESLAGDETRGWGPPASKDGTAAYFHSCNHGKKSIALDFRNAQDLALVRDLVREADVVIENFKVGGLTKFGLDYAALNALNPRLVYCSVTGFGQDGPYAHRAGYDFIIQAMSGIMDITGEPDGDPMKPGVAYADIFTGLYSVIAIQAALGARDKTGAGQHIDMALFDTQLGVLANQASTYLMTGNTPKRMGNAHPSIVPYQVFQAADAPFVIACGNDGQFVQLSKAFGQDYHTDPRFVTNKDRLAHREELIALMQAIIAKQPRDKLLKMMEGAGVHAGPINTIAEAFDDPQIQHRGMKTAQWRLRNPIRFSDLELGGNTAPPELNEHGKEIRKNLWNTDN